MYVLLRFNFQTQAFATRLPIKA